MGLPALPGPARSQESTSRPAAKAAYAPGDQVRHTKFGDGIVVSCKPSGDDHMIEVAFKGGVGVKKLMQSFAGLAKV